jgi:hypothetical protein
MHFQLLRVASGMLALSMCLSLSACSKPESTPGEGPPTGTLDNADGKVIQGWAWDPQKPDTPIEVDIYDGKSLLGKTSADRFRKDLVENGKGNGRHGFLFPTPASLKDGRQHSIRAMISGSEIELKKSPKKVTFPSQQ